MSLVLLGAGCLLATTLFAYVSFKLGYTKGFDDGYLLRARLPALAPVRKGGTEPPSAA